MKNLNLLNRNQLEERKSLCKRKNHNGIMIGQVWKAIAIMIIHMVTIIRIIMESKDSNNSNSKDGNNQCNNNNNASHKEVHIVQ